MEKLASVLAAFVMGLYPGARKQSQIGAALIVSQNGCGAKWHVLLRAIGAFL